jgi:hypothetical protein
MPRSPLTVLTRAGFIGYGLVHLLFAWLIVQVAFGKPAQEGDQSGALRTLAEQPLGKSLVIAVGVGLLAMALWQAYEAVVGRGIERLASLGRTAAYLYFAWAALKARYRAVNTPDEIRPKVSA